MYKKGPAGKYLSYLRTNKGFKQTNPFKEIRKINCALPATFNKSSCMHIHIKGKYGKKANHKANCYVNHEMIIIKLIKTLL